MRILVFLFFIAPIAGFAQLGGLHSYEFLNVPINARSAGIGAENVSLRDQDVNQFHYNPASLNSQMANHFSISYLPFFADIKATSLSYATPSKNNVYGIGLTFFDYGEMVRTEANGDVTGDFRVREYALTGAAAHAIGNYVIGGSLKFAGSHLDTYSSLAVLADLGGMFVHPTRQWTVGLVFKNVGYAIKKYNQNTPVNMPFDVQIGTTYKLENLPLRFSITAHHLHQLDIVYLDPNKKVEKDLEGNEIREEKKLGDQIMRHFVFGGEFLLTKYLNIRFGYNHLRRKELRLKEKSAGAGFSIGGVIRVNAFELAYTRSFYHVRAASNHLTLITNFNSLIRKKERKTLDNND